MKLMDLLNVTRLGGLTKIKENGNQIQGLTFNKVEELKNRSVLDVYAVNDELHIEIDPEKQGN